MAVKLTDVAKKAGVSPTTVSRVINNYGYLSQKTISKVHAAMTELNYQPNALARSLQGKKSQLIGLVFPSISNPFFAELIEKLERNLFEKGYKSILCDSANNHIKEREYLNMLIANKVDGIIAGSHNLGIKEYENINLPIVSFDRYLADGIPIVSSDNYSGGVLATKLLITHGGKDIAIFTGTNKSSSPTNDRLKGYLDTINQNNLDPKVFNFSDDYSPTVKSMEISRILKTKKIDSVFCTDDLTALLLLNEAEKLGKSIPKDLKIIGYDGSNFIRSYFPKLTSIIQPIDEYVSLLINLLIQRIDGKSEDLEQYYKLPISIFHGESI